MVQCNTGETNKFDIIPSSFSLLSSSSYHLALRQNPPLLLLQPGPQPTTSPTQCMWSTHLSFSTLCAGPPRTPKMLSLATVACTSVVIPTSARRHLPLLVGCNSTPLYPGSAPVLQPPPSTNGSYIPLLIASLPTIANHSPDDNSADSHSIF